MSNKSFHSCVLLIFCFYNPIKSLEKYSKGHGPNNGIFDEPIKSLLLDQTKKQS